MKLFIRLSGKEINKCLFKSCISSSLFSPRQSYLDWRASGLIGFVNLDSKKRRERGKRLCMLTRWVGRRWSPFPVPMLTPEGLTGGVEKQNILAVIQWPGPEVFWIAVMSETPRSSCTSKWILVCSFFCPSDYYPAWSIFSICPGLSASIVPILI